MMHKQTAAVANAGTQNHLLETMRPAGGTPVPRNWQALHDDLTRRCSLFAALGLVFVKFSFLHEMFQVLLGTSFYILYLFTPPAAFGVFLSGGIGRVFKRRTAWWWSAFAAWLVITIPFSFWVGGSASSVLYYLRDHFAILILAAGSILSWKECKLALRLLAIAAAVDLCFITWFSAASGGRLQLAFAGTIGNANDLAAHMLLLICFLLFFVMRPGSSKFIRLLSVSFITWGLFTAMRTGSRGALVSIGVGVMTLLVRLPMRQRVGAMLLLPVILATVLVAIPEETRVRVLSFSDNESSSVEAIMSKQSREYLLRKSIEYTLANPLFGIGMGQFSVYEGTQSRAEGEAGNWHETHNSYTQLSSECGIPALLLFLGAIGSTLALLFKISRKARAAQHKEIDVACTCLILAFTTFCTAMAFLSIAYRFYLPALAGIVIAFAAAAEHEIAMMPNWRNRH